MADLLLALYFLVVIIMQYTRIKDIIIFERKTKGMYVAMVIGCFILLGMTVYYGSTLVHYITGLLGILMLIGSMYVTGVSKDNFYYYTPPRTRRFIGSKVPFADSKKIRLETYHKNKLIVRFVAHSSERMIKLSKEDEIELKDILDYDFRMVDK